MAVNMTYAILVEGHGSGLDCMSAVEYHAERLKEIFGDRVRIGYARHGRPTVDEAVEGIIADGYTKMVVVPLFYAPGWFTDGNTMKRFNVDPETRHGTCSVGGHELQVYVSRMFITDDRMKDIVIKIVGTKAGRADGILLLGHGSKDGRNLNISRVFAEHLTYCGRRVVCCSNEFDHPDLQEGVDALARRAGSITILPMFVSPGNHTRVEIPEKLGIDPKTREGYTTADGREVPVRILDELGLNPDITQILVDMIHEAEY